MTVSIKSISIYQITVRLTVALVTWAGLTGKLARASQVSAPPYPLLFITTVTEQRRLRPYSELPFTLYSVTPANDWSTFNPIVQYTKHLSLSSFITRWLRSRSKTVKQEKAKTSWKLRFFFCYNNSKFAVHADPCSPAQCCVRYRFNTCVWIEQGTVVVICCLKCIN